MRAPMMTAMPPALPAIVSTSPVWRPARTSSPSGFIAVDDRQSAPGGACRAVERREEPVAGRVDLDPAIAGEQAANGRVVPLHELPPAAIAEPGGDRPSSPRCR